MATAFPDKSNGPDIDLRSERGRAIAAFCLLAVFFFVAGVTNRTEAIDSLQFSADAEVAPFWSNPDSRMMLFYRINRIVFRAVDSLGLGLSVHSVLGFLGSIYAAGAVLLLFRLLRVAFKLSTTASIAGALTLAVSYGFLRYANEVEVYSGSAFLILLCLNLLFHGFTKIPFKVGQAALLGAASGVAVTYYQPIAFALFFAAAVLFLYKRYFIQYLAYGAAGVGTYALCIIAAIWTEHGHAPTIREAMSLLLSRTEEFAPPAFGLMSFVKAGLNVIHDFASLTWLHALPGVEDFIKTSLPYRYYRAEKICFAANSYGLAWIGAVTFVAVMAWLVYLVIASLRERQHRPIDANIAFVFAWLALSAAPSLVLNPAESEVWILCLPPIAAILALYVYEPLKGRPWHLTLMVALLLCHNIVGGLAAFWNEKGDLYASRTAWIREHGERGDWLLTPTDWQGGLRILLYPIARKPDGRIKDQFFNFMGFSNDAAVVKNWGNDVVISPDDVLRTLKTRGGRVFVLDLSPSPSPGQPVSDRLSTLDHLLRAHGKVVDTRSGGATYQIDKAGLPDALPGS